MEFSFSDKNKIGVYSLSGNLIGEADGIAMTESFSEKLELGYEQFVIDLSDLQHINSSGLGVLITLLTKFRNKNGDLFIIKPSEHVNKLLIMTKLQAIFNIADSEEEALQKIK